MSQGKEGQVASVMMLGSALPPMMPPHADRTQARTMVGGPRGVTQMIGSRGSGGHHLSLEMGRVLVFV